MLFFREMLGKERMRLPISVTQIEEELSLFTAITNNRYNDSNMKKTVFFFLLKR